MKDINRIRLRSAGVRPNVKNQEKSNVLSQKSEREVPSAKPIRPRPRPHKCSNLTQNSCSERPEITEASDLKVKVSECRRKVKEDLWEEGGRVCSLQEVAVKTPSGVVTVEHFGDAMTPNVDFVEPGVRLYKRNVSKYTYKSQLPVSKTSIGAAKSSASTKILSRPPLTCDCISNPQPPVTLQSLPKVIVKDSANFAKFRHDNSDGKQHLYSNVPAGTPRKISELMPYPSKTKTHTLVVPRNSRARVSDHHLKRIISSNSLFSYAEPTRNPGSLSKSRLSRIAESSASNFSSKASSKRPIIHVVSGQGDFSSKMSENLVLKRIVYRAEGVLHDEKLASPRKSAAKSKIHSAGRVRHPRTIHTF